MAMRLGLVDGQVYYGQSLAEWVTVGWLGQAARSANVRLAVPDSRNTSDQTPGVAWVNEGMWVVTCPACGGSTVLIWLRSPLTMCPECWNGDIGGKWRLVELPSKQDRDGIEAALLVRRESNRQTWIARGTPEWVRATIAQVNHDDRILSGQTVADLLRENVERGLEIA